MISSAAGGVPLLMVRHPAGPSASLLAFSWGHNASEDAFLVELVARAVCRAAPIVEGSRLAGLGMLVCSHYAGSVCFLTMLLLFARPSSFLQLLR